MIQTVSPVFTEEKDLLDLAVRHGLAPSSIVGWNENLAQDSYFLSLAGLAPDAHVLDLSPHGMRVGLSLANHVRKGRYVALEWLEPWVGFARDLVALHGLEDSVQLHQGEPTELLTLGESWDAIVFWDLAFRGDGSHVLQLVQIAAQLLRPGGVVVFQYRTPVFLEQPRVVRRGLLSDGLAPEFGIQETNWTHWEQVAKTSECRFEIVGKRLTPETKVVFIRK